MLWIGNIRGRFDLMKKAVSQANASGKTFSVCGDMILQGESPVECISLALDHAAHIVIGLDTMLLFQSMHGNPDAWAELKTRGGEKLIAALKPFESMVQDLEGQSAFFYRDSDKKYMIVPTSIPDGLTSESDFKCPAHYFFEEDKTHQELASLLKKSDMKQCLIPSRSGIDKDGLIYMNSGKNTLTCYDHQTGAVMLLAG